MLLADAPKCALCSTPVAYRDAPCARCQGKGVRPFSRVLAICHYAEPIRTMIHHLKFHYDWPTGEFLGEIAAKHNETKKLAEQCDLIVPIPLHRVRRMSRGYNQAELIASRLVKLYDLKLSKSLIRVRNTEAQTKLHFREHRNANVKNAFALVDPKNIAGKRVLLVDDVMTTGSTVRAAAKEIKRGDPKSIAVLVLAIADSKNRSFEAT